MNLLGFNIRYIDPSAPGQQIIVKRRHILLAIHQLPCLSIVFLIQLLIEPAASEIIRAKGAIVGYSLFFLYFNYLSRLIQL